MKSQLPAIFALALVAGVATAQDNPPAPPPRPDTPVYPPDPPRAPDAPQRPEADRPPGFRRPGNDRPAAEAQDGQTPRRPFMQRPGGERPVGEGQRPDEGQPPRAARGENPPRDGDPRGENVPRFPFQQQAAQKLRPYLGVVTAPAPPPVAAQAGLPEGFGLVVEDVLADSPAKAAGVERFDVLAKFDEQRLVEPTQLAALVRATKKDAEITLTLLRRGEEKKVTMKIGEKLLADRQPGIPRLPMPDFGNLMRRFEEARGPIGDRANDPGKRAQEIGREWQKRMQEFQEKIEQWRKDPSQKFPETPVFPMSGPTERAGPLPSDVLREMRPGGAPAVRKSQDGTTTTWSTANAHVSIKDDAGEIDVRSDNGHRVVTAKNPQGETIFHGAIDTEEQRRELPEAVRRKLNQIDARTRLEHEPPRESNAPRSGGGAAVQ